MKLSREATTIVDVHGFGVVLIELTSEHIVVYFRLPELLLLKKSSCIRDNQEKYH